MTLLPAGYSWGICISHDVDHLSHGEHSFGTIAKFWVVCLKEFLTLRRNPFSLLRVVKNSIFTKNDSWDCIEKICEIDFRNSIPSTFFFAMNKGTGIDYSREQVQAKVKRIPANFEIGVHGQFPDDEEKCREELSALRKMVFRAPTGIRMHYLKTSEKMLENLKSAGYEYDSTEYDSTEYGNTGKKGKSSKSGLSSLKQPYKITGEKADGLVEIPVHLMDTYMFSPFYENLRVKDATAKFEQLIEKAKKESKIISIIIHQRSVSDDMPRQRKFYEWLVRRVSQDETCWKTNCKEIVRRINGARA